MRQLETKDLRNIVLLGHGHSGKTTLAEALLFEAGATDRLGRVEDGNTVCDFDPEETRRVVSISLALAPLEWKGAKINLIDTPGLFDFEGEALEGMRAADAAVITVSGKSGVNVGAERAWRRLKKSGKPCAFYITKLDEERADYNRVLDDLRRHFGVQVCPLVAPGENGGLVSLLDMTERDPKGGSKPAAETPALTEMRTALLEAVAETDEALMEKYFAGEPFTQEELLRGIHNGFLSAGITPVFCGAQGSKAGPTLLLDAFVSLFPNPAEAAPEKADADGSEVEIPAKADGPLRVLVFKTLADPYVGKLSYLKVVSGTLTSDASIVNARTGDAEKLGKLYLLRGKKQTEVPQLVAGDIGAVAKMNSPLTGDTLCSPGSVVTLTGIDFPAPCLSMAVEPKAKGDEEKIGAGLRRLMEEDPTLHFAVNHETHQQVISGLGEQHLDVVVSKLKAKFGTQVTLEMPRVAYRETIRKKVRVQGRHKKQTGGHGQFGDVWIEFEPGEAEDLTFEEKVFGGSVPRNFFPAVEKGLRESIVHGVLAGYPVVHLKATLVDGSYHPVDSSEMAFKLAANLAYKAGLAQAGPVLLEPIGNLHAQVPEANMGDIMGEINKRRGRVLGMGAGEDGLQQIEAEAPMAEMHDFSTLLRSVTQGRGSFTFSFTRYEEAPPQVAQAITAEASPHDAAAG